MPAPSASGKSATRVSAREHDEAAGESEGEGEEARGATRLRERDEVGEGDEEQRDQRDGEDGERAAEDVRGPAPAQGEAGERDREQRRDGDRAAPSEHVRREPVALVRDDVELPLVALEGSLELLVGRAACEAVARTTGVSQAR